MPSVEFHLQDPTNDKVGVWLPEDILECLAALWPPVICYPTLRKHQYPMDVANVCLTTAVRGSGLASSAFGLLHCPEAVQHLTQLWRYGPWLDRLKELTDIVIVLVQQESDREAGIFENQPQQIQARFAAAPGCGSNQTPKPLQGPSAAVGDADQSDLEDSDGNAPGSALFTSDFGGDDEGASAESSPESFCSERTRITPAGFSKMAGILRKMPPLIRGGRRAVLVRRC